MGLFDSKKASKQTQASKLDSSKRGTESHKDSSNIAFARIRRLEQRVTTLETALSAARRDLSRIEQRQYRAKEQPLQTPANVEGVTRVQSGKGSLMDSLPAGLFE